MFGATITVLTPGRWTHTCGGCGKNSASRPSCSTRCAGLGIGFWKSDFELPTRSYLSEMKAPSANIQAPKKLQAPDIKSSARVRLELGAFLPSFLCGR